MFVNKETTCLLTYLLVSHAFQLNICHSTE